MEGKEENSVEAVNLQVTLSDGDSNDDKSMNNEGKSNNQIDGEYNASSEIYSNSDNIRDAAESLLSQPISKVLVNYETDTYLLFKLEEKKDEENIEDTTPEFQIICHDTTISANPINVLMASIRQFLESRHGKLAFGSKEILLRIDSLDIEICEDNAYNKHISFNDIQTIFNILKERSETAEEDCIPECLIATISLRQRFVSRYNALVELTESSATLKNIRPFSNDEGHPVILDDNMPSYEKIVVNLEDDDDDTDMISVKYDSRSQSE